MHPSISQNFASRQGQTAQYYALALNCESNTLSLMGKNVAEDIAKRQRSAINKFMAERGLIVTSWCKRAGISEGTLRAFLKEGGLSLSANTLERLAMVENVTMGRLLGEELGNEIDDALLEACANAILSASKKLSKRLTLPEAMTLSVKMYKEIMRYRGAGQQISPSESVAAQLLREKRA